MRKLILKIAGVVSWLVLLIAAVHLSGKLTESKQETADLRDRLKGVTEETALNQGPSAADQAKTRAELRTLKEALSTANEKMKQLQRRAALEREKTLRKSAKEHETLTTGIAEVLSRTEIPREKLETLLAGLPPGDRLRLLAQITTPKTVKPVEADEPPKAVEVKTPPGDKPAKKDVPKLATYTVKRGDNLTRIARKFDVSAARLMKLNGISNANMLRVGQVLKIPQN